MQNRYVGDIGDYLKLAILRALSPKHRLGVAWWLFPDEDHNKDGRHIGCLQKPEQWRRFDPPLFDALAEIVASGQRNVRVLETANILPGAIFASEVIPAGRPVADRPHRRRQWLARVQSTVEEADVLFVDPDNGLEPAGYSLGSSNVGKSILLSELCKLAKPERGLVVYHHHTRRRGGHQSEIAHWAGRLRASGFAKVDALRARPYSPRTFFLLDAPIEVRRRGEQIASNWQGWITWYPDKALGGGASLNTLAPRREALVPAGVPTSASPAPDEPSIPTLPLAANNSNRRRTGATTQVGYVNRNGQEVISPTGKPGTDHGQYAYVLRCRTCGHEYAANGSDIWLRRCPAHDGVARGLAF